LSSDRDVIWREVRGTKDGIKRLIWHCWVVVRPRYNDGVAARQSERAAEWNRC
jgi:hypothetical protein